MVVRLNDAASMVRDDVEVFANRPPEDGGGEHQCYELVQIPPLESHDVRGTEGEAKPFEDLPFDDVVYAERLGRLRPAAQVAPGIALVPITQEFQKRKQEVRPSLRFNRNLIAPGVKRSTGALLTIGRPSMEHERAA